eukprot:6155188-Pyramimonas_sp.AAC.1
MAPCKLEARVRRMKRYQAIARSPRQNDQVLAALFGTHVFESQETAIGDDITEDANPWAKRVNADILD